IPAQFALPPELRPLMLIPVGPVVLTATVFVFLLSIKVYGPAMGIVLAVLTLIPCVGLIALLVVNSKATSTLQRAGFRVGFLGATLSDFDRAARDERDRD